MTHRTAYPNLIGATEDLILGQGDEQDVITSEQELGKDFWDDLQEAKENFSFRLNGLTPVATIPEGLVNKWIREGFDFWSAPANEILQKLRLEHYDAFIISGDKTFDH
ncbi:hypothetical protein Q9295_10150 [Xinfangfangia sp. CPCC 101601]|uniref:Uncharacterized protein n=1 Tax=Pseudogemmobacter lacusdianii TaxID=3069608 RepID=A0ABU0VYA4_9RHOB|nr:hypothetical protein [Xinfangfangia sp. CPCC 101601]MDQ2066739.1 hypothetical protein [Xinfangfangia sp. CPCC 101601]